METSTVLAAVNTAALMVIVIVIVFLFIELRRFKRLEEEIQHYLSKSK